MHWIIWRETNLSVEFFCLNFSVESFCLNFLLSDMFVKRLRYLLIEKSYVIDFVKKYSLQEKRLHKLLRMKQLFFKYNHD